MASRTNNYFPLSADLRLRRADERGISAFFEMSPRDLPIYELEAPLTAAVREAGRLIVQAPTGSGKSTQVPQMLWRHGLLGAGEVVVLQPRRVAARTVAARVASERSGKLGAEVGYQIRFDDHTSVGTRICFVTEGILLRWLQPNNSVPAEKNYLLHLQQVVK